MQLLSFKFSCRLSLREKKGPTNQPRLRQKTKTFSRKAGISLKIKKRLVKPFASSPPALIMNSKFLFFSFFCSTSTSSQKEEFTPPPLPGLYNPHFFAKFRSPGCGGPNLFFLAIKLCSFISSFFRTKQNFHFGRKIFERQLRSNQQKTGNLSR